MTARTERQKRDIRLALSLCMNHPPKKGKAIGVRLARVGDFDIYIEVGPARPVVQGKQVAAWARCIGIERRKKGPPC